MSRSRHIEQLSKNAFEIAYATFRIGSSIENRVFVEHLEAWSLSLLEEITALNKEKAYAAILNMRYLVSLARDLNYLNQANSDIFLEEIKGIDLAIAESFSRNDSDVDLSLIFNRDNKITSDNPQYKGFDVRSDRKEDYRAAIVNSHGPVQFGNSAIRQSAIIDKIRQNKVCRLKELEDMFPHASERTIRYDVQSLIERGVLERVGNGGPATAYRLKQEIAHELPAPSY